jgi:hypothetical protein
MQQQNLSFFIVLVLYYFSFYFYIVEGACEGYEDEIEGQVKLMFQPAEETLWGAKAMVEAGVLENPKVDAAIDPLNVISHIHIEYFKKKRAIKSESQCGFHRKTVQVYRSYDNGTRFLYFDYIEWYNFL